MAADRPTDPMTAPGNRPDCYPDNGTDGTDGGRAEAGTGKGSEDGAESDPRNGVEKGEEETSGDGAEDSAGSASATVPGSSTSPDPGTGPGPRPVTFVLVAMVAAALVAIGFLAVQAVEARGKRENRAEALHVARQLAVNFITLDYRTFDRDLNRVRKLTAGQLDRETEAAFSELRELVADNKMTSKGQVLDAGLVSVDQDSARALVVADSTVTNSATKEPRQRHYRFQLDLSRDGSGWHVVDLQIVG